MSRTERKTESRILPPAQPIEIIAGEGEILLRQFIPEDAEEIFELIDRNRLHLSQYNDDTAQKYPTLESVLESITNPSNPNKLRFAIRVKEVYVGTVNLTPEDDGFNKCEVGYYLGSEFTGNGYMTQAVEALTAYAFETLGSQELFAKVHEANTPSINVLLRAGYRQIREDGDKLIFIIKGVI